MPDTEPTSAPVDFFGLMPGEVDEAVKGLGWPTFRANQVRDWAYKKMVGDPAGMSNLAKSDRDRLSGAFRFVSSTVTRRQDSSDGTQKLLLTWPNAANAETVMIPDADRRTACVSSQVGCPVARWVASSAPADSRV
jgi:23S rRNA (adenine2503-C2)-methyltransferase